MNIIVLYIIEPFATFFELFGVAIVVYAGLITIKRFVGKEFLHRKIRKKRIEHREEIRVELGHKMLLGLEFFLAGDIIRTVITPTYEAIGLLGVLVIIRSILSFFITKDIKNS
ncbi:DUF1622 domain-containing protein [Patescibacteria group bacterium]